MFRHKIALYNTSFVPAMQNVADILSICQDPLSDFQEFAEVVGQTLNQQNIEQGFPTCTWRWEVMPQSDFETLLAYKNTRVLIRTRNNTGASGFDFADYSCYAQRPTAEVDAFYPLLRRNVELVFSGLVLVP